MGEVILVCLVGLREASIALVACGGSCVTHITCVHEECLEPSLRAWQKLAMLYFVIADLLKPHRREMTMPQANSLSKVVRPLPRGRITLPIEFRRRLNIDDKSMLRVSLKGTKIEIIPLRPLPQQEPIREYIEDEIKRFLKEDRLDQKTARRVRRLLGRRV